MNRATRLVGYDDGFVPLPKAVAVALAEHRLLRADVAILVALYRRAHRATNRVSMTLDALADLTGWRRGRDRLTVGYLHERLSFLRENGWLSYTSTPGANGHVYDIELHPVPVPGRPERDRSRSPGGSPSRRDSETGFVIGSEAASESAPPEPPEGPSERLSRSRRGDTRSREQAATAVVMRDSANAEREITGAPQNSEEKTNPSVTERLKERRLDLDHVEGTDAETDNDRFLAAIEQVTGQRKDDAAAAVAPVRRVAIAWPDTTGLTSEEAVSAECDALVDAGHGQWVVPDGEATP